MGIFTDLEEGKFRALIPARSGSKSVVDKNLQEIDGFSLLDYAIAAARSILPSESVWVSTDSEKYAELALKLGAEVKFLRPQEISGDATTDLEVFQHALDFENQTENILAEYWLHIRPTTPARRPATLRNAIQSFLKYPGGLHSLRSVHETKFQPMKWAILDNADLLQTLCGSRSLDAANMPRASYPRVSIPNGYIDILRASVIRSGSMYGEKCIGFKTDEVTDIDYIEDLNVCRDAVNFAPELRSWLEAQRSN